jgi:hypothetical protein
MITHPVIPEKAFTGLDSGSRHSAWKTHENALVRARPG